MAVIKAANITLTMEAPVGRLTVISFSVVSVASVTSISSKASALGNLIGNSMSSILVRDGLVMLTFMGLNYAVATFPSVTVIPSSQALISSR